MKALWLLRHAKSNWDDPDLDDFERPLAPRGRKAAKRIGRYLAAQPNPPELVLCSCAVRARETWERVARHLDRPPPVEHRMALYLAEPEEIMAAARAASAALSSLLIVGHNPGFELLYDQLAGQAPVPADAKSFPTAALARFDCDIDTWQALSADTVRLASFVRPRDL